MDFSPCPASSREPFFFLHDDGPEDTALVEYTTEFSAAAYGGKAPNRLSVAPRRRPFPPAKRKADEQFVIHEEVAVVEEEPSPQPLPPQQQPQTQQSQVEEINEESVLGSRSMNAGGKKETRRSNKGLNAAPRRGTRRISGLLAAHQEQVRVEQERLRTRSRPEREVPASRVSGGGDKQENIFLPRTRAQAAVREKKTRHTTTTTTTTATAAIATTKPMAPTRLAASKRVSGETAAAKVTRKSTETAASRSKLSGDKRSLQTAPKRPLPLQPSKSQLHSSAVDRHGALTGKENIAPGKKSVVELDSQPARKRAVNGEPKVVKPKAKAIQSTAISHQKKRPMSPKPRKTSLERLSGSRKPVTKPATTKINAADIGLPDSQPIISNQSKGVSLVKAAAALSSTIRSKKRSLDAIDLSTDESLGDFSIGSISSGRSSASSSDLNAHESAKWGLRLIKRPKRSNASMKDDPNPIIQDDIPRPDMYESSWLDAQESSLTMLLNEMLDVGAVDTFSGASTRSQLLKKYNSDPFPVLYKRLQASLLYGALSIPKDILDKNNKLSEDVGLKRRFLDLFLKTYSLAPLACCLEVVIGRVVAGAGEYKNVEAFLERFFVRAEDDDGQWSTKNSSSKNGVKVWAEGEEMGEKAWTLRRTLLRSFLLILLLDIGKTEGIINGCLFLNTSPFKSSDEVVHGLSRLLLPSLGDVLRPLSHINYLPTHKQSPLDEYPYHITNLAVDLRDGIRLTRVVEILLRQAVPGSLKGPLSSQLKYPAASRAVKMANAQVVMNFLDDRNANPGGITANDLVDGNRERTLGLLWVLVSKWGLGRILDWNDLRRHILRLQKKLESSKRLSLSIEHPVWDESDGDNGDYEGKLQLWARYVARVHGVEIENFTTSFADGKAFNAIIDEYERYFPLANRATSSNASLPEKLRALGCSNPFSSLFAPGKLAKGRVFDSNFVISALAFLCSRLMGWSIATRSAGLIQAAYRRHLHRAVIWKRLRLLVLAKHAAEYVTTKTRVVNAAVTIQRAFRRALQRRMERFFRAIVGVQSCIRGLLVRERLEDMGVVKFRSKMAMNRFLVDDDQGGDEYFRQQRQRQQEEEEVEEEESGVYEQDVSYEDGEVTVDYLAAAAALDDEDEVEEEEEEEEEQHTIISDRVEHTMVSVCDETMTTDIWLVYGREGI